MSCYYYSEPNKKGEKRMGRGLNKKVAKLESSEIASLISDLPEIDYENEASDDLASAILNHPGYSNLDESIINWAWKGIDITTEY